jgi:hypothetical protein
MKNNIYYIYDEDKVNNGQAMNNTIYYIYPNN